jgi:hypothetical protein
MAHHLRGARRAVTGRSHNFVTVDPSAITILYWPQPATTTEWPEVSGLRVPRGVSRWWRDPAIVLRDRRGVPFPPAIEEAQSLLTDVIATGALAERQRTWYESRYERSTPR